MSKTDYDLSRIKAFVFDIDGVLSPSTVPLGLDGMPARMANVKDGFAINLARKSGFKFAIITGGVSEAILNRFKLLDIDDVFMEVADKLPVLKRWMAENNLSPDEVVYSGDDLPDYHCMQYVGLSVAPADAAVEIRDIAYYISPCAGGHGVGRDIIEQVMKAQDKWMSNDKAFGW